MKRFVLPTLLALLVPLTPSPAKTGGGDSGHCPSRESIIAGALPQADRTWRGAIRTPPAVSSRDLFLAALTYCEAKTNLARLDKLFDVATEMQDRDPKSKTYGNFRWDSHTPAILDKNAVDFCMQGGAPLWILHGAEIPPAARDKLRKLLEIGMEGLKKHRVSDEYTNIALMSAANLILLGEALDRPAAAEEGAKRLDAIVAAMRRGGTHEYDSPTYYGVDLDDLTLLETLAKDIRARDAARGLLEYFWTDIALNWFPASQKLGGARSRDYDFVSGLGALDQHLMANGWIPTNAHQRITSIFPAVAHWRPPARLRKIAETELPRLVEQCWGANTNQFRIHYLRSDVSLSCAGSAYGGWMDFPLCVDLHGDRIEPRGYFIPDGRHDPYGKIKIMERSGHEKTLHLQPYWAASQRGPDAIALAVYREKDLATNAPSLESHFVLPVKADEFRIGDSPLVITSGSTASCDIKRGAAFVMRRGTAAVGIRVPWARSCDGAPVTARFVYDRNPHGVARITVDHGANRAALSAGSLPAAAFWIRIGSNLKDDAAYEKWRAAFASAETEVDVSIERIDFRAAGSDGALRINARVPFTEPATIEPAASRHCLALDGRDLGKEILDRVPRVAK